ncbi:MAG: nucleoside-diphosphate kinase [Candidatus Bathyarchaeota archaeon]|jgi:nucleoside-diphosphate kinase
MEREFIMIKPDGIQRALVGETVSRIERAGLKLIGIKMLQVSPEQAKKHYEIHDGKAFYEGLIDFITSGPVVVMVVEGDDAVRHTRKLVGATDPSDATPGSIRGDYALDISRNVIHAADSDENAILEYSIYFDESEFVSYKRIDEDWLYE